MRLTLRTLLAYMDDILDPGDREELAEKIEASDFADDLMHRTRDTTRRLRLSAPQVVASGMGLDPNSVAEYLDNVLSPDQVGDFERICLESDMHLAEVASCHHVLTMVLGEPAAVDPIARRRMYNVPQEAEARKRIRIEAAHTPAAATPPPPPTAGSPEAVAVTPSYAPPHSTSSDEVPEYLRTSFFSTYRIPLAALAAALLVAVTLLFASGGLQWFSDEPAPAVASTGDSADPDAARTPPAADTSFDPTPPPLVMPELSESPGSQPSVAEEETLSGQSSNWYALNENETPDRYAITDPSGADGGSSVDTTSMLPAAGDGSPSGREDSGDSMIDGGSMPVGMDVAETDVAPLTEEAIELVEEVDETIQATAELGTYLGGSSVLLTYDEEEAAWFRLAPRSPVFVGESLLALPAFRSRMTLASGIHVELSGGTQIGLARAGDIEAAHLPELDPNLPAIDVVYGRIIMVNTTNEPNSLRLTLGHWTGNARLSRNATLAVEVERQYVPGNDPRQAPAPVVARLYAPDGGVEWQDESGEIVADLPGEWTITEAMTSPLATELPPPGWIDEEPAEQRSERRYGAPVIESGLATDRPVDGQLLEIFHSGRRKEVKSLAARSSVYVGAFVPFIESLRDSEQRANWNTHIETLRTAMAMSPESAERVWDTLVEQRGEQAAGDLYEMLCGYSDEEIGLTPEAVKTGALAQLINWLEEDSLDYRVLAVHELREITGKTLMANPAGDPDDRARGIRLWRARLESGELGPGPQL